MCNYDLACYYFIYDILSHNAVFAKQTYDIVKSSYYYQDNEMLSETEIMKHSLNTTHLTIFPVQSKFVLDFDFGALNVHI